MFFAHRVWFNLQASLVTDDKYQIEAIYKLLMKIKLLSFYVSEDISLANSREIINFLKGKEMYDLLDEKLRAKFKGERRTTNALADLLGANKL